MKLFKLNVAHYAPKDSHKSIEGFLIANNDREIYDYLVKEKCEHWLDRDEDGPIEIYDDNLDVVGTESYEEKMIRLKGDMNDEDEEYDDLYYGKTVYSWEEVFGHISDDVYKTMIGFASAVDVNKVVE